MSLPRLAGPLAAALVALALPAHAHAVLIDTVSMQASATTPAQGQIDLVAGQRYRLEVSGTIVQTDQAGFEREYDALYCFRTTGDTFGCQAQDGKTSSGSSQLMVTTGVDSEEFCPIDWRPGPSDAPCSAAHGHEPYHASHYYSVDYYPRETGPLRAGGMLALGRCPGDCPLTFSGSYTIEIFASDAQWLTATRYDMPALGEVIEIMSPPIPGDAAAVTADVRADEGAVAEDVLTVVMSAEDEREADEYIDGCVIFGALAGISVSPRVEGGDTNYDALYAACRQMALEALKRRPARPAGTASRCHAIVKPIHRGSRPPTARQHRRALRRLKSSVRASCSAPSASRMTVRIRAHGAGNTARELLGEQALTGYARIPSPDGDGGTVAVRWAHR